jgi:hypothetical protein
MKAVPTVSTMPRMIPSRKFMAVPSLMDRNSCLRNRFQPDKTESETSEQPSLDDSDHAADDRRNVGNLRRNAKLN